MTVELVVFDADHTLYTPKTEKAYERKFAYLAQHVSADVNAIKDAWEATLEQVKDSLDPEKRRRKQVIRQMLDRLDVSYDTETVDTAYSIFWEEVATGLVYEDDVSQVLRDLKEDGVQLAIATDEFPDALLMKLDTVLDADPDDVFDMIVTPEDVDTMKPSIAYYTTLLDAFDVPAEHAVMVGDSWERDLAPAQEQGMVTVLLNPLDADGDPDYVINHITEIEDVVAELR